MRYDFTPLFRSTVGFDQLSHLLNQVHRSESEAPTYPPYNIEKLGDDAYRITMAVAGFAEHELSITAQENALLVTGSQAKGDDEKEKNFLHRGIAGRAFERRFQLAEHIKVTGASLANGLLHIELQREVPEFAKPRAVPITAGTSLELPKAQMN